MIMNVRSHKRASASRTQVWMAVLALVLIVSTVPALLAQSSSSGESNPGVAGVSADQNPNSADGAQGSQAAAPAKPAATDGSSLGPYTFHSQFEVGYRFASRVGGNDQMYRSQVNLYEGARLFNSYMSLRSTPGVGLFDRFDLSLNNLGDPYGTARLNVSRSDLYDLRASYRDMNYYHFISTFDNQLLGQGNTFSQHNLNTDYRNTDVELRLFPTHRIVPFVGYSRSTSTGPGFTTVESTGNEFLLQTQWRYAADEYRGGVQFNLSTLNLTVEEGYRFLKNDTMITSAGQPQGNENNPVYLGTPITLTSLNGGYHGRVKLPTSRILAKFTPFQNLRMTARYSYTMGDVDSDMGEIRTGSFVDLNDFLAYSTAADGFNGRAKSPNHNGALLVEYLPFSRLKLTDNVDVLDYHVSGAGLLSTLYLNASSIFGPGPSSSKTVTDLLNTQFAYSQVRNQAEAELDLGHGFAVRAGHRYTYVKVDSDDSEDVNSVDAAVNTAIVGMVYRPGSWLRLGLDFENNTTNRAITRTDLFDYDSLNLDWRIGSWKGFSASGRFTARHNSDPASDISYKARDHNYSASLNYDPSERISIGLDYSLADLFSDMLIVVPQNLQETSSIFNERYSGIGGRIALTVYRGTKVELGYRGIINRGTFPIDYHQPYASFWIPLGSSKLAFKPAWQYYRYIQKLGTLENYQTNLVTLSLVYSR
ncbi:MAG: hypothetical protein ABSC02_08735 [Acidobacteriota bacterium]